MADPNLNARENEFCDVYLERARVAMLVSACSEIEQLTGVLGTLTNSIDAEMVRRSVAVRVHDLNRVIQGALTESSVNSFDVRKASSTVYGPAWWSSAGRREMVSP